MARVLLVDDDEASLDLMRRALESDGHAITGAGSGTEARDILEHDPGAFDCLVTDVNMPGLSGVELLREANKLCPTLKLVVISGFLDQLESGRAAVPAGLTTLAKPFTLEQIRQAVRQALQT